MTSATWGQDLEAFWRHLCTSTVKGATRIAPYLQEAPLADE